MRAFTLLLILSLFACDSMSQTEISIQEFKFDGIFGTTARDTTSVYCLMGIGYFLAPTSGNIDSVIVSWIAEHPKAIVKPVYSSGPTFTDDKNSTQTYCWIMDGEDNLNIWLVQQGCVHGQNMQYPTADVKKRLGMDLIDDKELNEQVFVTETEYEQFINKVQHASNKAHENKLGIWNE